MTERILREILGSIGARVDGDTIVITGRAFVDGERKAFKVLRRAEKGDKPEAQKALDMARKIWFEEASCL